LFCRHHFDHRFDRDSDLLRAKIAANQSAAVQALRTMTSAEQTFASTYSDGYALTLAQLGGPVGSRSCVNAGLIDEVLERLRL